MPQIALTIAADHPAYAGHFPGQPILPGVVLIDAAQRIIEAQQGIVLNGLAVAKFHHAVTPGETLALEYLPSDRSVSFDILGTDTQGATRKIASGQFTVSTDA